MTEEMKPKVRRRRRRKAQVTGGISVSILLRGKEREIKLECQRRFEERGFFVFLSPGEFGKVVRRQFAISDVVSLEVEEAFMPYEQVQAPRDVQEPRGPVIASNPVLASRKGLRGGVNPDGMPMSELEDGTVVPAGFMS